MRSKPPALGAVGQRVRDGLLRRRQGMLEGGGGLAREVPKWPEAAAWWERSKLRFPRHDPHFDVLLPWLYRWLHRRKPHRLLALAQAREDMHILDIGGGTGRVIRHFPKGATLVVVDPSRNMLRSTGVPTPWWLRLQGRAEALPFAPGSFHRVLIVDALHHFAYPEQGLQEAWRVLRPGGLLVIEEPDVEHPLGRWIPTVERLLGMRSRFFTVRELSALLPQARVVHVERQGIHVWLVLAKSEAQGAGA